MVVFSQTFDDLSALQQHNALANANPMEWIWPCEAAWTRAPVEVQAFYTYWYDASPDKLKELGDTQILDISALLPSVTSPFNLEQVPSSIFVRESYATMFSNIYHKGLDTPFGGVIINGQPGTGKTLSQFLNLALLLQLKQSVLFSLDGARVLLFHNRKAYSSTIAAHLPLPKPYNVRESWIWSVFDHPKQEEPDDYLTGRSHWVIPVQSASPHNSRYTRWKKIRHPRVFYLDLWSVDELRRGIQHHTNFKDLYKELLSQPNFADVLATKNTLPLETSVLKLLEEYEAETTGNRRSPSVEGAIDYFLTKTANHFGPVPRDVFNAIFSWDACDRDLRNAIPRSYVDLKALLNLALQGLDSATPMSDRIIALSAVEGGQECSLCFKSPYICEGVFQALRRACQEPERDGISEFLHNPYTSALAGMILETMCP